MNSDSGTSRARLKRLISDYGMLGVLLLLCVLFSILTLDEQFPTGKAAAKSVCDSHLFRMPTNTKIIAIGSSSAQDSLFTGELSKLLQRDTFTAINGDPQAIRAYLERTRDVPGLRIVIATTNAVAPIVTAIKAQVASLQTAEIVSPQSRRWPTFLLAENIRNVANQITVIAIIAIGMTIVIITAGIDLSVGSLIALCAVIVTWLIGQWGAESAGTAVMLGAAVIGIILCGAVGAFSGVMITRYRIPPFIATLAMMQVAAGIGYIISQGRPIYQIPGQLSSGLDAASIRCLEFQQR